MRVEIVDLGSWEVADLDTHELCEPWVTDEAWDTADAIDEWCIRHHADHDYPDSWDLAVRCEGGPWHRVEVQVRTEPVFVVGKLKALQGGR